MERNAVLSPLLPFGHHLCPHLFNWCHSCICWGIYWSDIQKCVVLFKIIYLIQRLHEKQIKFPKLLLYTKSFKCPSSSLNSPPSPLCFFYPTTTSQPPRLNSKTRPLPASSPLTPNILFHSSLFHTRPTLFCIFWVHQKIFHCKPTFTANPLH